MPTHNRQGLLAKNLIGNEVYSNFLQQLADGTAASRGGAQPLALTTHHATRLVSDVNFLASYEVRALIFSDELFITAS